LACFCRRFYDLTLFFFAIAHIFGASPARSKTGVFSKSPGLVPEAVSSAACGGASVVASSPITVSLAALPESCDRVGTCSPASADLESCLLRGILLSLTRPIRTRASCSVPFLRTRHSVTRTTHTAIFRVTQCRLPDRCLTPCDRIKITLTEPVGSDAPSQPRILVPLPLAARAAVIAPMGGPTRRRNFGDRATARKSVP
jgi:hypothetical protein